MTYLPTLPRTDIRHDEVYAPEALELEQPAQVPATA